MQFQIRGSHPLWPAFPEPFFYRSPITSFQSPATAGLPPAAGHCCDPATPRSPFESHGLGSSDFARHYSRNHGCFLFLRVLRWFTSPGSLVPAMYSPERNRCSHLLGSPIRTSPDLRLLACPRGFSQLATSFFACLRLGILTHALSSLTIKLTSHTYSLSTLLYLCVLPVRYSVVKDRLLLIAFSYQPSAISFPLSARPAEN